MISLAIKVKNSDIRRYKCQNQNAQEFISVHWHPGYIVMLFEPLLLGQPSASITVFSTVYFVCSSKKEKKWKKYT